MRFGKMLFVDVGFFVDIGVIQIFSDEPVQKGFGEGHFFLFQQLFQTDGLHDFFTLFQFQTKQAHHEPLFALLPAWSFPCLCQ